MIKKLRWKNFAPSGDYLHVVSVTWGKNLLPRLHSHDYAEIFFIDSGVCSHSINGERIELKQGDIVFMRPNDIHELRPLERREGFRFTNIAFQESTRLTLLERFPKEFGAFYSLSSEALPFYKSLGHRYTEVAETVTALSRCPHTPFEIERFLINLVALLQPRSLSERSDGAPEWLQAAILRLQEPEIFSGGVSALVQAAGRSPEHVARTAKFYFGKSPSELVTEARMSYASRELRLTSKSVTEVGYACGYDSPSWFFQIFRDRFGLSPLKYRKNQKGIL